MRGKVVKSQGTTWLRYAPTAQNPLDPNVVGAFGQELPPVFLAFTVGAAGAASDEVSYDITRLVTLAERLRTLRTPDELRKTFGQLKQLLDACSSLRLPLKNLVLDVNGAYYDSWADTLRFVYLPFEGLIPDVRKTREFFEGLASYVSAADPDAQQVLASYASYFSGSPLFNPMDFSRFLAGVSQPATQVNWNAVQAGQAARKADSSTTALGASAVGAAASGGSGTMAAAPGAGGSAEGGASEWGGRQIHARPESSGGERSGADDRAERGAHVRLDPGTTVLGSLMFDFEDAADPGPAAVPASVLSSERGAAPESAREGTAVLDVPPAGAAEGRQGSSAGGIGASAWEAPSAREASAGREAPAGQKTSAGQKALPEDAQPAPAAVQFWLRRRSTGEEVQVAGERFVVGKSKYSTYQVRHTTTVSRSHAILSVEGEACWIEDDGSRNGTYLDNRRLEPHKRTRLKDGMVIRMSDEEFDFSEKRP